MAHQNFDKIFQENLNEIILPLARKILGTPPEVRFKKLTRRLPRTLERVPDFLKIAVLPDGKPLYVLHFELQAATDPDMAWRMLEYKAILMRKFRLPVKQFVIFVGSGQSNMTTELTDEDSLVFRFKLVDLKTIDYRQFIDSTQPEEVLLALLADFRGVPPKEIISRILLQLKKTLPTDLECSKFVTQLELLSPLRNLEEVTFKVIEAMPVYLEIDETSSPRYKKGFEKGIEKGIKLASEKRNVEFIRALLMSGEMSVSKIALLVGVEESFVLLVKKELEAKN